MNYLEKLSDLDNLIKAKSDEAQSFQSIISARFTRRSRYSSRSGSSRRYIGTRPSSSSRSSGGAGTTTTRPSTNSPSSSAPSGSRYTRNTSSTSRSSRYVPSDRYSNSSRSNGVQGLEHSGKNAYDNFQLKSLRSYNLNLENLTQNFLNQNDPELAADFRESSSFRAKYLRNLESLVDNINVRRVGTVGIVNNTNSLLNISNEGSLEDRLKLANHFMTAIADSQDDIDKVVENRMTVFIANDIRSGNTNTGGYYSTADHMVIKEFPESNGSGIVIGNNQDRTSFGLVAIHELTHALDLYDGRIDGKLEGFDSQWDNIRNDALRKFRTNSYQLSGLSSHYLKYSTTNSMEFLAVMSQFYHLDKNDLARNLPEVFNALDQYFRA